MKDNKIQTEALRLAYEAPCVELMCWENDILAANDASTEADGGEYPDTWN